MIPNGKAMYYFDNKGNLWVKDKKERRKATEFEIDDIKRASNNPNYKKTEFPFDMIQLQNNSLIYRIAGINAFNNFCKKNRLKKQVALGLTAIVTAVSLNAATVLVKNYNNNKVFNDVSDEVIYKSQDDKNFLVSLKGLMEENKVDYKVFEEETKEEETKEEKAKDIKTNDNIVTIDADYIPSQDMDVNENAKKYDDLLNEICPKYGISPNIIRSMMCQESAACGYNLLKIDAEQWLDQVVNTTDGKGNNISFVITYNKEAYSDVNYVVSPSELSNPEVNINIGCYMFRYNYSMCNNSIEDSILMHNIGIGNYNSYRQNYPSGNVEPYKVFSVILDKVGYDSARNYGDPNYVYNIYKNNFSGEPFIVNNDDGTRNVLVVNSTGIDGTFDRESYYKNNKTK